MQRNLGFQLACVLAIGLTAGCGGSQTPDRQAANGDGQAAPTGAKPRSNVVLITVDSLRADRVGFGGRAAAGTDQMDALAARGTIFRQAYTTAPEAAPALASLLTGLYPPGHGVLTAETDPLPASAITLAERLHEQGYRTGAFTGAVLLHPKYGFGQGFDKYLSFFEEAPNPSRMPEIGVKAEIVADQALEFLEGTQTAPFLLWVNFFNPHYPYTPPPPFDTQYKDDEYQGELAYVDQQIGRIVQKLRSYDLEEKTIVVLAGVHGEGLGDHGEAYHGTTLQQATVRVPLVITGPGMAAGRQVDAAASLVDVAPTLEALLGMSAAPGDGRSLLSAPEPARPIYIHTELPVRFFGWSPLTCVISGSHKFVLGTRGEMFDLAADPGEKKDLAKDPGAATEAARLRGLAAAYADSASLKRAARLPGEAVARTLAELGYPTRAARTPRDPRDGIAIANDVLKGHYQLRRDSLQAARFLMHDVLERDPDNFIGLLDSALLAGAQGKVDDARRMLLRAQSLRPEAGEPYYQLGQMTWQLDRDKGADRARRLWQVAALLDPMNEEALYDAACAYARQGKPKESLDTLALALNAGFRNYRMLAADPDLDSIRTDPRFDQITEGKAKRAAAPVKPASTN